MQTKFLVALLAVSSLVVAAPTLEARTKPKANEYDSTDCSGPMAYHHAPGWLGLMNECVSMNVTTHSVYINSGTIGKGFTAFNGPNCDGNVLGATDVGPYLQGANANRNCVNLDALFVPVGTDPAGPYAVGYRINSLQFWPAIN